jgi:hypothetical protein
VKDIFSSSQEEAVQNRSHILSKADLADDIPADSYLAYGRHPHSQLPQAIGNANGELGDGKHTKSKLAYGHYTDGKLPDGDHALCDQEPACLLVPADGNMHPRQTQYVSLALPLKSAKTIIFNHRKNRLPLFSHLCS